MNEVCAHIYIGVEQWKLSKCHSSSNVQRRKTRYSLVANLQSPRNRDIEVAKEFVDAAHPPLFRPFNFKHYNESRWSENRRDGQALDFMRIKNP